jgi:hypothetical protein
MSSYGFPRVKQLKLSYLEAGTCYLQPYHKCPSLISVLQLQKQLLFFDVYLQAYHIPRLSIVSMLRNALSKIFFAY